MDADWIRSHECDCNQKDSEEVWQSMPPICLYLLIRLTDFVDIFSVSNNDFGDFNVLF